MKHLFEEDHDMFGSTEAIDIDTTNIEYGLDPLEILIQLQEIQLELAKAELRKRNIAFASTYGGPRPVTKPLVVENYTGGTLRLVTKSNI